ncbi:small oligopeptide transporter, OPT family [Metarhizium album ARSEF 1941]|uniref:Small oligopeptide transporter, OPT family n=1 Tax=Metarhizium album (strain ARSEF 1941) TaxID=1081103 RepID=A0A0B2WRV5_METAS|nr:small oligopeptide transporter, OPT family [Metarhizium album ARSEF 1941]KHN98781.1 small oligopeptide transporter, OPT family [Metarhizium album ARSEF 1941]
MPLSIFRKRHEVEEIMPVPEPVEGNSSGVDHLKHLAAFEKAHKLDPNLPIDELNDVDAALATGNAEKGLEIEHALMEDNSPYPEVRAVVRNYDVDVPANTIRAWVIGLLLCTVGSGVNMLFSLRNPTVAITTYVVQLVAYPIGRGWDMIFPDKVWNVCGVKFNLRPGKFNFKEHVVIVAMSNAAYGGGALYATDVLLTQKVFYKQEFGLAFQLLFGITTLCTGYGMAGLARRFLVWPAAMIWPADLVNCALFYTLHDHSRSDPSKTNGWTIGRYKLFLIVSCAAFVWYWFPGWIFRGLSYFAIACWIAPNSVVVNKIFGNNHGYGLIPITFDWTVATGFIGSPLIPPFYAIVNVLGGIIFFFVIVSMGIHFSGSWYADYMPVQSSKSYDNTGAPYNVSRILDANFNFNETAYKEYSPLYLSTQFIMAYGMSFAAMSAVLVHVALYHGKELWRQFRMARHQEDDVHMRLMKKYRDAEDWWYAALFIVMVGTSFGVVTGWPTGFPAWAFVVCLLLPIIWLIPIGLIQGISNIQLGLNVLTEFIIGYMVPGRPLAMMMFKNYGYISMSQALYFAQDLKLGHYMKVPPRVMFSSQLIASIWSAIIQIAVMNWALAKIPDICNDDQKDSYTCPSGHVYYTASVIWGAIGPARIFSHGATYANLQWFWLVGAATPILTWLLARRWPRSFWRYVCTPVIYGGTGLLPPATVHIFLCWGVVGIMFNYFVKRRYTGWWLQYNYIVSAALDCGLIISTLVIFFTLYLTSASAPAWWGNDGMTETLDWHAQAITKHVAPGEIFGPAVFP